MSQNWSPLYKLYRILSVVPYGWPETERTEIAEGILSKLKQRPEAAVENLNGMIKLEKDYLQELKQEISVTYGLRKPVFYVAAGGAISCLGVIANSSIAVGLGFGVTSIGLLYNFSWRRHYRQAEKIHARRAEKLEDVRKSLERLNVGEVSVKLEEIEPEELSF